MASHPLLQDQAFGSLPLEQQVAIALQAHTTLSAYCCCTLSVAYHLQSCACCVLRIACICVHVYCVYTCIVYFVYMCISCILCICVYRVYRVIRLYVYIVYIVYFVYMCISCISCISCICVRPAALCYAVDIAASCCCYKRNALFRYRDAFGNKSL
jgi:hypothetical protein